MGFNREQRRELAKLSKVELIANLELEHDRKMQYQTLAIKANEDAQQQTKNALAMAIQNMTPVAMEVLREQYNFTESDAKKFEVAFFSKFRDLLDNLGMEEQGEGLQAQDSNATTESNIEQTATKSKIIIP
jgi:hypothetical protein